MAVPRQAQAHGFAKVRNPAKHGLTLPDVPAVGSPGTDDQAIRCQPDRTPHPITVLGTNRFEGLSDHRRLGSPEGEKVDHVQLAAAPLVRSP